MVVTPPGDTPLTVTGEPVAPIVAADVLPLVHAPPAVASLNVIVEALHIVVDPRIGVFGLIVTTEVAIQPVAVTW